MAKSGSGLSWDPWKMYDISAQELKAVEERAKIRQTLKAEWQRKVSDPYRNRTGYIFDPAVQRYVSMRATGFDHFKATPKSAFTGLYIVVLPILFFGLLINKDRSEREASYRNGDVPYKDRSFKFLS